MIEIGLFYVYSAEYIVHIMPMIVSEDTGFCMAKSVAVLIPSTVQGSLITEVVVTARCMTAHFWK